MSSWPGIRAPGAMPSDHSGKLTVKQAAQALGVSVRTMRRRLAEGKLSAIRELVGEQEVTLIDGAELARYAQSVGQTLALGTRAAESDRQGQTGAEGEGTKGIEGQPGAGGYDTEGQGEAPAPSASAGNLAQTEGETGAPYGKQGQPGAGGYDTERQGVVFALGQARALQEQLRSLTEERDYLRRVLENVTKALPQAREPATDPEKERLAEEVVKLQEELEAARRPWWSRMFGKRGGEAGE